MCVEVGVGVEWLARGDFGMTQGHYIYFAVYLYYYYISSTSYHQALDAGHWEPQPNRAAVIIKGDNTLTSLRMYLTLLLSSRTQLSSDFWLPFC